MWRKIHSNRDPRDTLFSELKKEFRPWFTGARKYGSAYISNHPRLFFYGMILLLLLSAALSFTVFRHPEKALAVPVKNRPDVMEDGFTRIMEATGRLNETLQLKTVIDSLTAKKHLTAADSLLLDSTLSRLQQIHQPSK